MKTPIKRGLSARRPSRLAALVVAISLLSMVCISARAGSDTGTKTAPDGSAAAAATSASGTTTPAPINPATLPPTVAVSADNFDPGTEPPDYTNWVTVINSPQFGVASGASPMRSLQTTVRVRF